MCERERERACEREKGGGACERKRRKRLLHTDKSVQPRGTSERCGAARPSDAARRGGASGREMRRGAGGRHGAQERYGAARRGSSSRAARRGADAWAPGCAAPIFQWSGAARRGCVHTPGVGGLEAAELGDRRDALARALKDGSCQQRERAASERWRRWWMGKQSGAKGGGGGGWG